MTYTVQINLTEYIYMNLWKQHINDMKNPKTFKGQHTLFNNRKIKGVYKISVKI